MASSYLCYYSKVNGRVKVDLRHFKFAPQASSYGQIAKSIWEFGVEPKTDKVPQNSYRPEGTRYGNYPSYYFEELTPRVL